MMINDPAVRRYCRAIRGWLPCSRKLKNQIMVKIKNSMQEFLEQNPNADFAQLQEHFGDPQTIASTYVENTGTAEILKDLRIRRRIITMVFTTVAIVLFLWAGTVTWGIIREINSSSAPYIEVVTD